MKIKLLLSLFFIGAASYVFSQTDTVKTLTKKTYKVPMRDGVKLFTVALLPNNYSQLSPILIARTPYSADVPIKEDSTLSADSLPIYLSSFLKDGYILVLQDIRGKFKSEGKMEIHQPLIHLNNAAAVDESTDTYDTVDWLVKNIKSNNGSVGIYGVSYPGWLALVGAVDPHPALKASSEQACMSDLFLGDDFHHNGAFRLSYGMEYTYEIEFDGTTDSHFPFKQYDLFDWYLKLGSLKNVNEKYFKGKIPTWNNFVQHPSYDVFWQKNSPLSYIDYPQIPQLHVGGYYDQEDLNGPQLMYNKMEKKDTFNRNFIVLGPWNHGQWAQSNADSLGKITFESKTGTWFRVLQKKWFDYWLKGIGDGKFVEANCFQTGTNKWKTYSAWPPKNVEIKKLYTIADNTISFSKPEIKSGAVSYISDPDKPVPYRTLPIEATYSEGSRWYTWHVEDQRFVSDRPDVMSFKADSLKEDFTVTGKVMAHLFVSTTATDADFVVKLIDVYPDMDSKNLAMSSFQLPVAMEVFRGRFRKSFEKPEPFTPDKPEEIVIDLHDINHTFLKGHKMMVQIQSTWFPVIDRNPQKYVPNIFEATEKDFVKATHTIYCNKRFATYIELPVVKE